MNAAALLRQAEAAGLRLHPRDGQLRIEADHPPDAALLNALAAHKADLLALLQAEPSATTDARTTGPSTEQDTCGPDIRSTPPNAHPEWQWQLAASFHVVPRLRIVSSTPPASRATRQAGRAQASGHPKQKQPIV